MYIVAVCMKLTDTVMMAKNMLAVCTCRHQFLTFSTFQALYWKLYRGDLSWMYSNTIINTFKKIIIIILFPRQWRDGLIVNIFKKGDREDPGNYRGITLLSVVGKVFCKIINNRLVQCLDKEGALHEGQAGFRLNRGCMDNVYTLNEIVQGRLRENKKTYAFFLDVQKAYDTVWHDGLWYKLWDMGVKGRMWRVIKKMYMSSRSAVLLEGEKSDSFNVDQGVAQGCSLSPILFSVFINDLLKEVEQAELGIQLSSGKTFGGMLFADDFVGVSDSKENLQKLIDVVYSYCSKWRLRANVIKSAVMVFSKDAVNGCWKWGSIVFQKYLLIVI